MVAMEEEDPMQVRAAQILVNLRYRELRRRPEWVLKQPGEAEAEASASPGTMAATKVMPSSEAASAGTLAARAPQVSLQSGDASLSGIVAAGVPERWPKAKRSGSRGETPKELEQSHAAAAAKGKGSGVVPSGQQERCAEMPAASAQRPAVAALYYAAMAGTGTGSSTSVAPAKEPMKTSSPNSPLDYGSGRSGAPSSADDAALPQAKRKATGASGSIGGDGEGCNSPVKLGPVAEEEKPMPISFEPGVQSETRASSSKGAPLPFDLNVEYRPDEDDDGCADTTESSV